MATLEDKLLGEKKEYYCSSSESDEEQNSDDETATPKTIEVDSGPPPFQPSPGDGTTNTGPKGVIKDWEVFKRLEVDKRIEREKERQELIQKYSFVCSSQIKEETENDPELAELLEDPFLLDYSKQRIEEMLGKIADLPKFGKFLTLSTGQEFLDAIDNENKIVTVVVHVSNDKVSACINMNSCLNNLSKEYPEVKFCKLLTSVPGVSERFKTKGVPALLAYKNGILVGNFVRVTEDIGTDFSETDVENFLIENGILLDKSCIPVLTRQNVKNNDLD